MLFALTSILRPVPETSEDRLTHSPGKWNRDSRRLR